MVNVQDTENYFVVESCVNKYNTDIEAICKDRIVIRMNGIMGLLSRVIMMYFTVVLKGGYDIL